MTQLYSDKSYVAIQNNYKEHYSDRASVMIKTTHNEHKFREYAHTESSRLSGKEREREREREGGGGGGGGA